MAKRRCKGKTKKGAQCKAAPLTESDFCLAHSDEETRDNAGFGGAQEGAGRPRRPRIIEELQRRIEVDIDRWLAPLEAALEEGKPIQMWDGDKRQHYIKFVPDPALGMKALKLALDRAYGRPRQEVELTGAEGGAVEIDFPDPDVRRALHGLVRAVATAREG